MLVEAPFDPGAFLQKFFYGLIPGLKSTIAEAEREMLAAKNRRGCSGSVEIDPANPAYPSDWFQPHTPAAMFEIQRAEELAQQMYELQRYLSRHPSWQVFAHLPVTDDRDGIQAPDWFFANSDSGINRHTII